MRLFLAIELPDAVRQELSQLAEPLARAVVDQCGVTCRFTVTPVQNLHITLKFLGEVEQAAVQPLSEAVARTGTAAPVSVRASHPVLLPPRGPIAVVAAGLGGEVAPLVELHRAVEGICEAHGLPRERRSYLPHITIARSRTPLPGRGRGVLHEQLQARLPVEAFQVSGFTLFESRLGGGPPKYIPLARFGG